jgi:predicted Zn finger-like uncharacterized protein
VSTLVTRCPECGTAFRVLPGQLSARAGRVRCGKCHAVFDGLAGLVDPGSAAEANEPSPQLALFEAGGRAPESETPVAVRSAPRRPVPDDDEPLPEFLEDEVARPRFSVAWGLTAFIALAMLAGQLAYHYRTELAALAPQTRPLLDEGCRLFDCEVRLPRRPDLLSIESSDLQADPRGESLIVLNAVIRNRAAFVQELPALELTLTDPDERPLVRRVLRPVEYRPGRGGTEARAQAIAPGAEAILRLHLDTGAMRATGYRLYLFYPA